MHNTAIVIAAYNRPYCLKRLLNSIAEANYMGHAVNLIISIDKSNNTEAAEVARLFEWNFGNKEIIQHDTHLGLKAHMFFCAGLTKAYENIILLEDDLLVSPFFYNYACTALNFYKNEKNVAGISLYAYSLSESSLLSFLPIKDDGSVYFMQYPSSWGLCLNKAQWEAFEVELNSGALDAFDREPIFVKNWGVHSWKRLMLKHLLKNNKYFVYPHISLTTNFFDKGTNTPVNMNMFQVPLQINPINYNYVSLEASKSVYDSYFEVTAACLNTYVKDFSAYNYVVDLQGVRDLKEFSPTYVLTVRKSKSPLFSYGSELKPLLMNVIFKTAGRDIFFAKIDDTPKKGGKIHYGHAEFKHLYSHKTLNTRFSFLSYFYLYIFIELKMFWKKIAK